MKEILKERFSKSLDTYQENAIIQRKMAEKLVDFLDVQYKNVLEIGCGTGLLTKQITERVLYNNYTAIDIVKECEPYIKSINENINFITSDIEDITLENQYDLIISNAVFQWLSDFKKFSKNIQKNIKEGGTFAFTTFGKNNFKELKDVSNLSLNYYSLDEIKSMFTEYDIEILEEETIEIEFNDIKEMLEHIKKTGVNSVSEKTWGIKEINNFKENYKKLYGDNVQLTYNPIFVLLRKS